MIDYSPYKSDDWVNNEILNHFGFVRAGNSRWIRGEVKIQSVTFDHIHLLRKGFNFDEVHLGRSYRFYTIGHLNYLMAEYYGETLI